MSFSSVTVAPPGADSPTRSGSRRRGREYPARPRPRLSVRPGTMGRVPYATAIVPAPAPVHALTVAVGDAGLVLVAFGAVAAAAVAERLGEPVDLDGARAAATVAQLTEYLDGNRRGFELPLDWRLASTAQRRVLGTLHDTVPFGATITYGELAVRSGAGSGHAAARAVGTIMGRNPLPVVVPCHRVLAAAPAGGEARFGAGRSGYGLGGFGGGRAVKEWLLAREGVLTPALDLGIG